MKQRDNMKQLEIAELLKIVVDLKLEIKQQQETLDMLMIMLEEKTFGDGAD